MSWVRKDEEKSKRKADVAVGSVGWEGMTPSSIRIKSGEVAITNETVEAMFGLPN